MTAATLLKVIETKQPGIINRVQQELNPSRSDLPAIKAIYQVYLLKTIYPGDFAMNRLVFVAVIARLYNPAALHVDFATMAGLSQQIALCFDKCSIRTVSYYLGQARHYYKNVGSFRDRVDQLCKEL